MSAAILPFDDRDGFIWFDGRLVPWREAKIHVLTHGLHYGSCVFEGERAYGGSIYKTAEHTNRLFKSAEMMGFDELIDPRETRNQLLYALRRGLYARQAAAEPVQRTAIMP